MKGAIGLLTLAGGIVGIVIAIERKSDFVEGVGWFVVGSTVGLIAELVIYKVAYNGK